MFDDVTQKELLQEFLSENREALQRIEQGLLQLETDPKNRDLLNSIFRDMHTVKGNCRMMGFVTLEGLTHRAETVLDLLREDKLVIDQAIGSTLFAVLDAVQQTLLVIGESGVEGGPDFSALISLLDKCQEGLASSSSVVADDELELGAEGFAIDLSGLEPLPAEDGSTPAVTTEALPPTIPQLDSANNKQLSSIRLPINKLDDLMDLVGELGAAFNQLRYFIANKPDSVGQSLEEMEQHLYHLQDEVLQYRLQPIGRIWDGYHRLVRDLAVATGKKVVLELVGEDTEVDRNVLLSIKESLGHLIRNAVDHGIEDAHERSGNGKSSVGLVKLSAEQRHGQIYMEVSDDGRGMDADKILLKAKQNGLVSEAQAAEMDKQEILKLIMEPGFSTTEEVSKISGRGTGMDVVQSAIDKIGGSISISSKVGEGSRFRLQIPQNMAIVPVLLVRGGGETYAIPQISIVELIAFYGDDINQNVEGKMQTPMVRVRDKLLPMVVLNRLLVRSGKGRRTGREVERLKSASQLHVVVLQTEDTQFALEVESIDEPTSLVIKPINNIFSNISILAGTAVMADGSVSFLLNVPELLKFIGNYTPQPTD